MTRTIAKKIRSLIEAWLAAATNNDIIESAPLVRAWVVDADYDAGDVSACDESLYRCRQAHRSQATWRPPDVPALWEPITRTHAGTFGDPIPAGSGTAYEAGKYYSHDGVIYLCTRSETLYYTPDALVGIYFEISEVES